MTIRRHTIDDRTVDFDLETGGTDPLRHPIIQIGASSRDDISGKEIESFEVKLKFNEAECDPEALKKAKYDPELWAKHAVDPITGLERIVYFLREHATYQKTSQAKGKKYYVADLAAYNAGFDRDFLWQLKEKLKAERERDIFLPANFHAACTLQRAISLFVDHKSLVRPPDYQLGSVCAHFGIEFSTNAAHDALYDARKSGELRIKLKAAEREIQLRHAA